MNVNHRRSEGTARSRRHAEGFERSRSSANDGASWGSSQVDAPMRQSQGGRLPTEGCRRDQRHRPDPPVAGEAVRMRSRRQCRERSNVGHRTTMSHRDDCSVNSRLSHETSREGGRDGPDASSRQPLQDGTYSGLTRGRQILKSEESRGRDSDSLIEIFGRAIGVDTDELIAKHEKKASKLWEELMSEVPFNEIKEFGQSVYRAMECFSEPSVPSSPRVSQYDSVKTSDPQQQKRSEFRESQNKKNYDPLYVFPTGYRFRRSLLRAQVVPTLNPRERVKLELIENEMSKHEQIAMNNNEGFSSTKQSLPHARIARKLQAQWDDLVASKCPNTGPQVIESIDCSFPISMAEDEKNMHSTTRNSLFDSLDMNAPGADNEDSEVMDDFPTSSPHAAENYFMGVEDTPPPLQPNGPTRRESSHDKENRQDYASRVSTNMSSLHARTLPEPVITKCLSQQSNWEGGWTGKDPPSSVRCAKSYPNNGPDMWGEIAVAMKGRDALLIPD